MAGIKASDDDRGDQAGAERGGLGDSTAEKGEHFGHPDRHIY